MVEADSAARAAASAAIEAPFVIPEVGVLRRGGGSSGALREATRKRQWLLDRIEDPNPWVRVAVAHWLGAIPPDEETTRCLQKQLSLETDFHAAEAFVGVLSKLGSSDVGPVIAELLKCDRTDLRQLGISAASGVHGPEMLYPLMEAYEEEVLDREPIVTTLIALKDHRALPLALRALDPASRTVIVRDAMAEASTAANTIYLIEAITTPDDVATLVRYYQATPWLEPRSRKMLIDVILKRGGPAVPIATLAGAFVRETDHETRATIARWILRSYLEPRKPPPFRHDPSDCTPWSAVLAARLPYDQMEVGRLLAPESAPYWQAINPSDDNDLLCPFGEVAASLGRRARVDFWRRVASIVGLRWVDYWMSHDLVRLASIEVTQDPNAALTLMNEAAERLGKTTDTGWALAEIRRRAERIKAARGTREGSSPENPKASVIERRGFTGAGLILMPDGTYSARASLSDGIIDVCSSQDEPGIRGRWTLELGYVILDPESAITPYLPLPETLVPLSVQGTDYLLLDQWAESTVAALESAEPFVGLFPGYRAEASGEHPRFPDAKLVIDAVVRNSSLPSKLRPLLLGPHRSGIGRQPRFPRNQGGDDAWPFAIPVKEGA
ncbi:MAG: HEAT repeat domain-containing protein [Acidobacteriota bacterium]